MKTFREKVYQVVSKIPQEKTLSYKEVARRAGKSQGKPGCWQCSKEK